MCESFEKLANKYAEQMAEQVADKRANERQIKTRSDDVISLMDSMKWTLEQAFNALKSKVKSEPLSLNNCRNSNKSL